MYFSAVAFYMTALLGYDEFLTTPLEYLNNFSNKNLQIANLLLKLFNSF